MWDPENAAKKEELSVSPGQQQQQALILQSPTENKQPSLSGKVPPLGASGQKREGVTEGDTDEMIEHSTDDQDTLQVQRTSRLPVEPMSLLIGFVLIFLSALSKTVHYQAKPGAPYAHISILPPTDFQMPPLQKVLQYALWTTTA
ncbi:hypothetical protein AOLI_G00076300 [Acnodon oligacanthus]